MPRQQEPIGTALVVEDDRGVRELVRHLLDGIGLTSIEAADGAEALHRLTQHRVDLVLLDVELPRLDGWQVLERIRATGDVPVLMITGRGLEVERVRGLRAGADDYLTKPFGRMELVARVEALLRRSPPGGRDLPEARYATIDDGRLRLDPIHNEAHFEGREIRLSRTEFRLLLALAAEAGHTVPAERLTEKLWGEGVEARGAQLRTYVGYVRGKLGDPEAIATVHGVGYRYG